MIPYGHQTIGDDDVAAVVAVLRGDWLTQGPTVQLFEEALASAVSARFAVAFSNGTAALHGAMATSGLGTGSMVVTSPLSFVASANCIRYAGAMPALVDIDETTLNIDVTRVPRCDGLVAVHYGGLPVDLSRLSFRPPVVIEDAAHALGARTPHGPVGNCADSDMCVFSFHPVKAITTGEGGAVTTNSPQLAAALRTFRNHGISPLPTTDPWYYEVLTHGYNYRLTDMQAALGVSQLSKLGMFIERRNYLAARYRAELKDCSITLPPEAPPGWLHAYHLFPVRLDHRRRVYQHLRNAGVATQVHYVPIYRHPVFGWPNGIESGFPATEAAYERLLSLPLYPTLTDQGQDYVIESLRASL